MDHDADGWDGWTAPTGPPAGAVPGVPGWFPDPWSSSTRRRWWTGKSWSFATTTAASASPAPASATGPAPSRPPGAAPEKPRTARALGLLAIVVLGLVAGLLGVRILVQLATSSDDSAPGASQRRPGSSTIPPDPSRSALSSLIVKPGDVAASLTVALLDGGDGLTQPTLDLCNGTFPSESRRTARLQDAVVNERTEVVLSTEAVLYKDPAGAEQAFAELGSVTASCPDAPVRSPVGEPTVTTTFNAAPDGDWPQTPTVNRKAYDFTTVDGAGKASHYVAVYLQRGRALVGVYFPRPDAVPTVAGQSGIAAVVGVFAERIAALPPSVVGS